MKALKCVVRNRETYPTMFLMNPPLAVNIAVISGVQGRDTGTLCTEPLGKESVSVHQGGFK